MRWQATPLLLTLLQALVSQAKIVNRCSGEDALKVDDAVQDAIKMANRATETMETKLDDDNFRAMYAAIFDDQDLGFVKRIYQAIGKIEGDSRKVSIFCDEKHLEKGSVRWIDNQFSYTADGETKYVQYEITDWDLSQKPGQRGLGTSYTTLGYVVESNGERIDVSDQAHIFIHRSRLNPETITDSEQKNAQDTRAIDQIVNEGLAQGDYKGQKVWYNTLDSIHPLSVTVFHELVHVVGGLQDPERSAAGRITDGPGDSMYGIQALYRAMRAANGVPDAERTIVYADAYTIVAKGWYLQLKKNVNGDHTGPTLWALGLIDPRTLFPPPEVIAQV